MYKGVFHSLHLYFCETSSVRALPDPASLSEVKSLNGDFKGQSDSFTVDLGLDPRTAVQSGPGRDPSSPKRLFNAGEVTESARAHTYILSSEVLP